MEKVEKNWKNINEFLSQAGPNLNILEEEIDVTVQKEYFELSGALGKHPRKYKTLCKTYVEQINNLFDENTDPATKKQMLVVLATIDDIAIYRSIESFSKQDTPLRSWAIIALQQSRMLIQSSLLDDPGIFISTGLGGQGRMLRYFCVYFNRHNEPLQEYQQQIVKNETETALRPLQGSIEQVDFYSGYSTLLLLLPIDSDLKSIFEGIISECNQYGNFLHENMIITNVKKLTEKEILQLLKKEKKEPF